MFTLVIIALCWSTLAGGLGVINDVGIDIGMCVIFSWTDVSTGWAGSSVSFIVVITGLLYGDAGIYDIYLF